MALALCLHAAGGWRPSGPWGGAATSLWLDPNSPDTLLAGARNSLLFRTVNGGARWERLPFPRHFSATLTAVMIHPAEPRLYLAAAEAPQSPYAGIWYSEDAGVSWQMARGVEGLSTQALVTWAKDPRRMAAATRDGVWWSTDAGRSWRRISVPYNHELRSVTAVAIDPEDDRVIYAGTTHLPWKTTDGGQSWRSIHDGMLDDSDVFSIFIDPARPARVLASACSGIYSSADGGASWSRFRGIPSEQRRTHVVRLEPGRPDVIYAGTTLGLLRSTDGGITFRRLNRLHVYSLAFDPRDPRRLYLATEGAGIWRSEDGGETAVRVNEGFASRRVAGIASADGILFVNLNQDGEYGGLFSSPDGGLTWVQVPPAKAPDEGHITMLAACPSRKDFLLAGNGARLLRSPDGGKVWQPVPLAAGPSPRLQAVACAGAAPGREQLLVGTDQGLWRSGDYGASWRPVRLTQANIRHNVVDLTRAGPLSSQVLARTTHAVYLSEDGGATWRVLNMLFAASSINDLAMTRSSLLAATFQGLFLSADGGRKWQKVEQGLEPGTVSALAVRPGHGDEVFAAQFGRILRSGDGGFTWAPVDGAQMPDISLRRLLFHHSEGQRLLAITPEAGVFYLELRLRELHNGN